MFFYYLNRGVMNSRTTPGEHVGHTRVHKYRPIYNAGPLSGPDATLAVVSCLFHGHITTRTNQ